MKLRETRFLAVLLLLTPVLVSAQETEWLIAPYLWYSDVSLDQSSGVSGGISASDLLDASDSAGMIRVEAARNRWGFTVDYVWVSASEDATIPLPPPFTGFNLRVDLDVSIVEFGGFFRPSGKDSGVDFLFGARNLNVDKTLLATPGGGGVTQRFDSDSQFTDAYVGARSLYRIGEKWDLTLRGDYSFGDTEGTLNLIGSIGYRFNDTFAMNLGYRHLAIELEEDVPGGVETTDIELSGPLLGFLFRF